jgi:hypothetical protein
MNIDLLPFSAFALESSAAGPRRPGESHTLTMQFGFAPAHPALEHAMEGTVSLPGPSPESATAWRAAVVPVRGSALTLTL